MSLRKRLWSALSLLVILATVLAGCVAPGAAPATGGASSAPAAEGPKGTLTVGLTTDIASIEVPNAPERQSANAAWTLYDALVFPEAPIHFNHLRIILMAPRRPKTPLIRPSVAFPAHVLAFFASLPQGRPIAGPDDER